MAKAYVSKISYRRDPQSNDMRRTDVDFNERIENAGYWETEQDARSACMILDNTRISITTAGGKSHVCEFQFEQRAPGQYVLFCEGPFLPVQSPPKSGYKSDLQTLSPVAIKADQHEVRASEHGDWGSVTCDQCQQKFFIGPNQIYGTRGNKTPIDYASEFEKELALDHEQNIPHQNAYDLGEI
jgi:hypothetical protein